MYDRLQQLLLLPGRTGQLLQLPVHRFRMDHRGAPGQLLSARLRLRVMDHYFDRGAPSADVRHLPTVLFSLCRDGRRDDHALPVQAEKFS